MAKRKEVPPCKECGGPQRGRYAHRESCSHYRGKKAGGKDGNPLRQVQGLLGKMTLDDLEKLKSSIDEVIVGWGPRIDQQIKELEEKRARIEKATKK